MHPSTHLVAVYFAVSTWHLAAADGGAQLRGAQAAPAQTVSCDVFMWPGAAETCGTCKARVPGLTARYGSCGRYCASLGLGCEGAWDAKPGAGCKASAVSSCSADAGAQSQPDPSPDAPRSEGICECSLPAGQTQFDRCGTHRWPIVKEKCASCMVKVNGTSLKANYGGTCAQYCSSLDGKVYGQQWFCGSAHVGSCSAFMQSEGNHNCMEPVPDAQDAVCWCIYPDF
uniref:Uncharacterized protein n=1 Tax=Alexandrium catenella TaxID=2925 RepID=A0A7S1WX12_ALECA|mmetsp:Transcript_98939/g.262790  ORF Transcript_98939/g.262790 Transcript_98939/m.262790 type:complete len:228 (+) Transcript_98939:62-745(+)